MLAWKFLYHDESPPLLLGHIEDRDLWRFKLPNTREIQANVFSHEYTFETWDRLMRAGQAELLQMSVAGAAIERKHHKDLAGLLKLCKRRMVIAGHDVPVAGLPYTMSSDAGAIMSEGELFAACYVDTEACDHHLRASTLRTLLPASVRAVVGTSTPQDSRCRAHMRWRWGKHDDFHRSRSRGHSGGTRTMRCASARKLWLVGRRVFR
jgi:hypothetical protein